MSLNAVRPVFIGFAMILLAPAGVAHAEEEAAVGDRRCLPISHIQRIEVLDDRTLLFHMRGRGPDYVNRLPFRCSGLRTHGTFIHSTSTNNYCDLDVITPIDTTIGMRLGSCPLGRFFAVEDEEEVQELREGD